MLYLSVFLTTAAIGGEKMIPVYRTLLYYWGILLYLFLTGTLFWILYWIFKIFRKKHLLLNKLVGWIFVWGAVLVIGLAIYNFEKPLHVENITISSQKVTRPYTFVQIGDIQLWSTPKRHLERTINLALEYNPDFIVMVGDFQEDNCTFVFHQWESWILP